MRHIIVSRHPATVDFVRREFPWMGDAEVKASVGPEDVRGACVVGNLPASLASLCGLYGAVEFTGLPPRGLEYGLAEMDAAGAKIAWYRVEALAGPRKSEQHADGCRLPSVGDRRDGWTCVAAYGAVDGFAAESVWEYRPSLLCPSCEGMGERPSAEGAGVVACAPCGGTGKA